MKKALLLIIFILTVLYSVDAQWYYKHCGVIDINNSTSEEFDCLWNKASRNSIGGAITTGIGIGAAGIGLIWGSYALRESYWYEWAAFLPISIMTAGLITLSVGLPIWITGAARKSNLRKNPHYNNLSFGTLKVAPTIKKNHFNNSYAFGLTASLSF